MIEPKNEFRFAPHELSCNSLTPHTGCFRTQWQVPKSLPYFNGHFPENPVLPAVAILDATGELIRQSLGLSQVTLSGVKSAKFMSPITPGLLLEIDLHRLSETEWQVEWKNPGLPPANHLVALLFLFCG
jgi:3-hydroxymyristoyl/3-hydroxydecanoyl-(acyl carrier protein) dehydratase